MTDFGLEKWYLDCVSENGDALIGYAARLRWGRIGLGYGARITMSEGSRSCQQQSLSFGTVTQEDGVIRWANDRLGVSGEWSGGDPIGSTIVVDEPSGRIEWECLGANCAVDVRIDGRPMTGVGYVERLSMTIPPWMLPFTELRWGRFISDDRRNHMVWTDMRGRVPRTWVWVDSGEPVSGTVDADGVRTDTAELVFLSSAPLRSDNVARTLLGRFEFMKKLLPEGLWSIQEDKQVSSCVLKTEDSESRGSSIHEVVTWGRS